MNDIRDLFPGRMRERAFQLKARRDTDGLVIAAVGAVPDKLSVFILLNYHLPVIAAAFAVIALRIQLRICLLYTSRCV